VLAVTEAVEEAKVRVVPLGPPAFATVAVTVAAALKTKPAGAFKTIVPVECPTGAFGNYWPRQGGISAAGAIRRNRAATGGSRNGDSAIRKRHLGGQARGLAGRRELERCAKFIFVERDIPGASDVAVSVSGDLPRLVRCAGAVVGIGVADVYHLQLHDLARRETAAGDGHDAPGG